MSEIIKQSIKRNKGKTVTVFLKNNFRFTGKITNSDDLFIELFDLKENKYRPISIEQISEIEEGREYDTP